MQNFKKKKESKWCHLNYLTQERRMERRIKVWTTLREKRSRGERPSTKLKINFNTLSCGSVEFAFLSAAKSTRPGAWAQMTLAPATKNYFYFKISLSKRDKRKSEIYHRVASEERKSVLSIVMGIVIPTMLAQDRPSMSCSGVGWMGVNFGGRGRAALRRWRSKKH